MNVKRLRRVLEFIDARLADDISLRDLAAEACLSPFHFSRLFLGATGTTPHRYLTGRRVAAAKAMILCGETSLAQIAFDAGFGSQGSFTRAFRRIAGMTPGQYRLSTEPQETNARPQDLRRSREPAAIGS